MGKRKAKHTQNVHSYLSPAVYSVGLYLIRINAADGEKRIVPATLLQLFQVILYLQPFIRRIKRETHTH